MKRLLVIFAAATLAAPAFAQTTATGVVFNDRNANGVRDAGEEGIPGVRVSNQREVTKTDASGRYTLPVTDNTILFVVKPRNWATAVDKQMVPRFYYIHKPNGSPKQKFPGVAPTGPLPASVDFPLHRQKEPNRFKALFFGDPQVRGNYEIQYLAHQILEDLVGTDAAFGVTLGDNSAAHLDTFPMLTRALAVTGIPWHYALGNHDENTDSPNDEFSAETYEAAFGPAYYSFDYGPVHFVTLDTVEWLGNTYRGGLGKRQLEWLTNDLALCPRDQLVVLSMHIPLSHVQERADVYRLLENRPNAVAIAGHEHWMGHHFLGRSDGFNGKQPLHEFINATACATFWSGPWNPEATPTALMLDGAPNGYSVFTFDGNRYSATYQAAERPASYQMTIFAPDEIALADAAKTDVVVNVFAGSEKSTVEMRLDDAGPWKSLPRVERTDAFLESLSTTVVKDTPANRRYPMPGKSLHIWQGALPATVQPGMHLINVRTTDMYGHTYADCRTIIVK